MRFILTSIVTALAIASAATAETHTVLANNTSFSPDAIDVAPGDTIIWQYNSGYPHTVTSGVPCKADGGFHGELQGSGETFTWNVPLDASGDIPYFCDPHCDMGMHGMITVVDGPAVLHVPTDEYPTIQSAIDAASDGDTIAIAAGTYYEHSLGIGDQDEELNLSVIGETHADGMPAVTIDAQQQGRVLTVGGYEYGQFNSEFHLSNLIITGGGNVTKGGGIYSGFGLTLENCTIVGNTATSQGGGVWNHGSKGDKRTEPVFNGCRFLGNAAPEGGGLWGFYAFSTLNDCVVSGNTADTGGGISEHALGSISLANSVVCGNAPDQIDGEWSDLGGSCVMGECFDNDRDGLPDFCTPDTDGILHVPDEYSSILLALQVALDGDTISIAAGTYAESAMLDTVGRAITIRGELYPDGTPAVILDGAGGEEGVFYCGNNEGPDTVFENLHITGGLAIWGGGLAIFDSSPTVNNCVFSNNRSHYMGGAVCCSGASPTFTNCNFNNNEANLSDWYYSYGGGAICSAPLTPDAAEGHPTFIGCVFEGNIAHPSQTYGWGGGAFTALESSLTLIDCTITDNSGVTAGGITYYEGSATDLALSGTTVCGNDPDQIFGDWTDNGGNTIEDECPNDCPADFDGDGTVGGGDLGLMLSAWGSNNATFDLDGSGEVNGGDLGLFLSFWGPCA